MAYLVLATNLLPQFLQGRQFSYEKATDGMRQILWGLFKKMVEVVVLLLVTSSRLQQVLLKL